MTALYKLYSIVDPYSGGIWPIVSALMGSKDASWRLHLVTWNSSDPLRGPGGVGWNGGLDGTVKKMQEETYRRTFTDCASRKQLKCRKPHTWKKATQCTEDKSTCCHLAQQLPGRRRSRYKQVLLCFPHSRSSQPVKATVDVHPSLQQQDYR